MSITPPGLVSGPALVQQPPLIPPVSAPQPVDTAFQSKTDSGASQQRDSASAYRPQPRVEKDLVYDRPAAAEQPAGRGFVSASESSGTARADVATINKPEPAASQNRAAANAAYAMVADAPVGMPPSILTPLRGG